MSPNVLSDRAAAFGRRAINPNDGDDVGFCVTLAAVYRLLAEIAREEDASALVVAASAA